ncbi:MAG TPA: hypothetical protein VJQ52_08800 [Steroidobacteraceae bacterium]|nr:hypothetical protein [Steroidobacteraceae bacterium]
MPRPLLLSLLVTFAVLTAQAAEEHPKAQTGEDLDEISDFNRAWWQWRRCIYRYEKVHGPTQDGKPPQVCGAEPQRSRAQSAGSGS